LLVITAVWITLAGLVVFKGKLSGTNWVGVALSLLGGALTTL
jgi:multidrug transporter EmrE-like cation transporter